MTNIEIDSRMRFLFDAVVDLAKDPKPLPVEFLPMEKDFEIIHLSLVALVTMVAEVVKRLPESE